MQAPTAAAARTAPPAPSRRDPCAPTGPESNADGRSRRARQDPSLVGPSRVDFHTLEEDIRRGPMRLPAAAPASAAGVQELSVDVPSGPAVPVLVRLPPHYSPDTEWPLMFAMHGGPPSQPAQTRSGAERMLGVWTEAAARAGWIVAAPGLTPSLTVGTRTEERLAYEVFHPEQARAVIGALRHGIASTRPIVSTGISLGSNYSIAFGAGEPGWLSAIVPVFTEGARAKRSCATCATRRFTSSRHARSQHPGDRRPRSLADIPTGFGYDLTYRDSATARTRASRSTTTMCCGGSTRGRARSTRARSSACRIRRSSRCPAGSGGSSRIRVRGLYGPSRSPRIAST